MLEDAGQCIADITAAIEIPVLLPTVAAEVAEEHGKKGAQSRTTHIKGTKDALSLIWPTNT